MYFYALYKEINNILKIMGRHKLVCNQKKEKKEKKEKEEKEEEKYEEKLEKEEKNDDNDDDLQDTKNESSTRPRGRPKKAVTQTTTQTKPKIFELEQSKEKSSIPLHIPLYDDSTSNDESEISQKNEFTMNENEKESEKKSSLRNFIMYLSEDDESEDDNNLKSLKKKLRKKDDLIKKLKDEIHTKSNDYNDTNYSMSQKKTPDIKMLNMKLFNINRDNKCHIGEKTNFACWWCTYNFENFPCFIPEKYNDGKFYVFGNFCSYNCALAYILKDDDYKVSNRVALIKRLYAELYDTKEPLFPSPPRELLNKFGGPMTIEEYRNEQQKLELKEYKIKFNNILQIPFHFDEINREYNVQRIL
jgi:hypothetical protein